MVGRAMNRFLARDRRVQSFFCTISSGCVALVLLAGILTVSAQEPSVPELLWKVKLKGAILSPPAVVDTQLVVPMTDRKVYRINSRNGQWAVIGKVNGTVTVTPKMETNRLFLSMASERKKDMQAVVAYSLAPWKRVWHWSLPNSSSTPLLYGETLYIGSEDGSLYALSTATGETRWRFRTARAVRSSPVMADSVLFIGSDDHRVYAVQAKDGKELWSYKTQGGVMAAPVIAGDAVYAVSYDQTLYCLDRVSGHLKWTFRTDGSLYGTPAVQGNRVFLGSNDRRVYCLDADTGTVSWRYETKGVIRATPVVSGSVVYVVSTDKQIYALNVQTGNLVWRYETQGSLTVTPVIVGGVLIVGSEDRYLYAFREQ